MTAIVIGALIGSGVTLLSPTAQASPLEECNIARDYPGWMDPAGSQYTVLLGGTPYANYNAGLIDCYLSFGSRSDAVTVLQRHLNRCNGKHLTEDGIYGTATRNAILEVQRATKIPADGEYGPRTRVSMKFYIHQISKDGHKLEYCGWRG